MKRIIPGVILMLFMGQALAQNSETIIKPVKQEVPVSDNLALKVTEFDFGKIPQNKPVYTSFEWTNTGSAALKLDNVTATCGCTTPEWSREAIEPGSSSSIKVGYNAASVGYFEKYITLVYNGNKTKQVKIKGTVWKAPEGSAPANSSVQFLKNQIQ